MLKTFLALVVCCPISDHAVLLRILTLKFQIVACIKNSLLLARKYACPRTLSVPRSEHSRKTVSFAPNGDYRVYYPLNLLRNARSFENRGISSDIPQF